MFRINKGLNGVLICALVIISIAVISMPASAFERPEFKDGLMGNWHSAGGFCIPCHYTLAGTEKAQAISRNCRCHSYYPKIKTKYKEIDMSKIFTLHREIICIRCHVGVNARENISAGDFHRVMSRTACLECHTFENGNYIKPKKTKCLDCHSDDPHVVHGSKTEKLCVTCHGEFGEEFNRKNFSLPSGSAANISMQPEKEYFTIGEFISMLIESITKIIR